MYFVGLLDKFDKNLRSNKESFVNRKNASFFGNPIGLFYIDLRILFFEKNKASSINMY